MFKTEMMWLGKGSDRQQGLWRKQFNIGLRQMTKLIIVQYEKNITVIVAVQVAEMPVWLFFSKLQAHVSVS